MNGIAITVIRVRTTSPPTTPEHKSIQKMIGNENLLPRVQKTFRLRSPLFFVSSQVIKVRASNCISQFSCDANPQTNPITYKIMETYPTKFSSDNKIADKCLKWMNAKTFETLQDFKFNHNIINNNFCHKIGFF